ncbi:MAG: flagellar hook capping FlgD N-terminal domain-containing protein [Solirubrobacteraceae bacterium]|jgi:flagellar basal-body rod modification protein FlgD
MTTVGATDATNASSSQTNALTNTSSQLNDSEFLQLMITQLKDQDPTSPTDPSSYLSELAQFTSVEQETNTATNTSTAEALGLLGQTVTYTDSAGDSQTGAVTSVDLSGSSPTLTIGGTSGISTSQVQSVS